MGSRVGCNALLGCFGSGHELGRTVVGGSAQAKPAWMASLAPETGVLRASSRTWLQLYLPSAAAIVTAAVGG